MKADLSIDPLRIEAFCRKWRIVEMSLFGSSLRDDFDDSSDVDVLVSFEAEGLWSLFDLARMQEELVGIFNRDVDLLTRRGVEQSPNWMRRKAILESAERIYAA